MALEQKPMGIDQLKIYFGGDVPLECRHVQRLQRLVFGLKKSGRIKLKHEVFKINKEVAHVGAWAKGRRENHHRP